MDQLTQITSDHSVELMLPRAVQKPINFDSIGGGAHFDVSGLEHIPEDELLTSPFDNIADRMFDSGNGVLKMWVGMPSELIEQGIQLALERSNGLPFRVEHATHKEAEDIIRFTELSKP